MNFTVEQREEMAKWGNRDIYALLEDIGELEEALRISCDAAAALTLAKQETADALHELRSAGAVISRGASALTYGEFLKWVDSGQDWLTLHTQQTKAPLMSPEIQRRLHEATVILSFFILPSQQMPVELQTLFSHWQSHDEGRDFGNWLARRWLLGFPFPPAETICSHHEGCGAPDPEAEANQ